MGKIMDISKAATAFGKYLTSKVGAGVGGVVKKVNSTIAEGRAIRKDFTNMVQKDLEEVKDFDGTDDDVKKLDQLNSFKYLRNLGEDLTGKKRYESTDAHGKKIMVPKSDEDMLISPRTKGNISLLVILAITFSGAGPFLLLGLIGVRFGLNIHRFIKNGMKSLRAAFGDKTSQNPAKSGPPSIDNGATPTGPSIQNVSAPQGPRMQNTANPTPPVNVNGQKTSLSQNNVLRSTFADAAQKLAAGQKTAPGPGSPAIPVKPLYSKAAPLRA
jgi:hypothetical protein